MSPIPGQSSSSFHVLVKPTGAVCNLNCRYCFFLSKEALYPGSDFRMSEAVLEAYIRQLFEAHSHAPEVSVSWQGGEPTLMGLDFYRHAVEVVERYKQPGQRVLYTIQTNGTRLDDEWAAFFKGHNYLVGLSLDGPREMHDAYRVDKGGAGTFDRVMRGWHVLQEHGVDTNILCTVHAANADHPLEVYHFFRDELGAQFLQFIPIVERVTPELRRLSRRGWGETTDGRRPLYRQEGHMVTPRSVKPKQFGAFLIGVFDEWVRRDVGRIYVQHFDVALANWVGEPPGICVFSETCGLALALEHNGDLYACDHYVEPGYRLGNVLETPLGEMVTSEQQRRFGRDKRATLPRYCLACDVRFACHGECPRHRFDRTPDGEEGLSYLCAGYKLFFHHVDGAMRFMTNELRQGRAPANVMRWMAYRDGQLEQAFARAGRDDPCPCGSGKKFRLCHGKPGAR
jgi:uncharacterized protein